MPTIAREASVAYGGFTVSTANGYILRDIMTSEDGYEHSVTEFTFTAVGTDTTDFAAKCAAAEAAFHVPHQALVVSGLGSRSFSHSGRTGFNAVPSISKIGHPADSGLSRTYRARVEVGRPADAGGTSGRRLTRTSINVAYGPQRRRTVTISGEWTGIGGTTARSTYESQITSYGNTITSGLGGTFKLLNEPQTAADDANNVIRISIVYEEILDTRVGGSDADIRSESLIMTRIDDQPGDSPEQGGPPYIRLGTIQVRYSAYLEKEGGNLSSKWDGLRSKIVSVARSTYGLGNVVVVHEAPEFDYTDYKINASMTLMGFPGNKVVECRAETTDDLDEGHVLVPVWDGDRFSRYKYQGPASETRTTRIEQTVIGLEDKIQGSPHIFKDMNQGHGELILKRTTTQKLPMVLGGARGNDSEKTTRLVETKVYERAKIKTGKNNGGALPDTPTGGSGNSQPQITDNPTFPTVGFGGG
jgi:hypothetical protein